MRRAGEGDRQPPPTRLRRIGKTRAMWSVEQCREVAREFLLGMGDRWSHTVAVSQAAEQLALRSDLVTEALVSAAWLYDIGYAEELVDTGMHAIDGARAMKRLGVPDRVVGLVAHHTGAQFEADERGLLEEWFALPAPNPLSLDILTLVDLSTSPTGQPIAAADRIADILSRYDEDHPVHRAVMRSGEDLLTSARRARSALELADDWPLGTAQGVGDPQAHRGM